MSKNENDLQKMLAEGEFPSLNIAYEEAERTIDRQLTQIDAIDIKASVFIAASGIVFTLVLTGLPALLRKIDLWTILLIFATIGTAILTTVSGFRAIRIEDYYFPGSIDRLIQKYLRLDDKRTKYQLLFESKDIYDHNKRIIQRKSDWVKASLFYLVVSYSLAIVTLIYAIILFATTPP